MDNKASLYSRQIGAIGSDTMGKLSNLKAYILDLDTIGLETAKCLCLLGIKKLYINDKRKITNTIKGNNYAISDSDSYNLVDESVINYLKQLNRYVDIEVSTL